MDVISLLQGALIVLRQVLDQVLIDNELIDWRRPSENECAILKNDLEKAYEHVDWWFVDNIFNRLGCDPNWRG